MLDFIENTDSLVDFLDFEDLKDFLYQYDKYIQEFYEEHDEGSNPVCMTEFYNNDYQIQKNETSCKIEIGSKVLPLVDFIDDDDLIDFLEENDVEHITITHIEDDNLWGITDKGIEIPYHLEKEYLILDK